MSLSFQDTYNIRNYFLCACFTGRKLKCIKKSDFFHGYTEHLRELGIEYPEPFPDALPTDCSLVLFPHNSFSPEREAGKFE